MAFGEEHVALCCGLCPEHQLHEFIAFKLHAFGKGQARRGFDTRNVGGRRIKAAEFLRVGFFERFNARRIAAHGHFARFARALGDAGARKRNGIGFKAGFARDQIDKAVSLRHGGTDWIANRAHFKRGINACYTRQTLRPTSTREEAKLYFRHTELCRWHSHAVMAAQRSFEAPTKRGAVDRCNHRLWAILDHSQHFVQARFNRRLTKFGDVSARKEGTAITAQDNRLDRIIGQRFGHSSVHPLADGSTKRVDRGAIEGDDEYIAVNCGG